MSGTTGHYSQLSGRLARFLAHQKARGMSESALARLPQISRAPEPFNLKPVIANRANSRWEAPVSEPEEPKVIRPTADRIEEIIDLVAAMAGIDGMQIRAVGKIQRRYSMPRAMVLFILTELKVPGRAQTRVFGYVNNSTVRVMAFKVRRHLRYGVSDAVDLHSRCMAEIRARWPEYK